MGQEKQGGEAVEAREGLRIGEAVQLHFAGKKKPCRQGVVVGLYDKFFNIHFGHYQESFLWVDQVFGELRIVRLGKRSAFRAG